MEDAAGKAAAESGAQPLHRPHQGAPDMSEPRP